MGGLEVPRLLLWCEQRGGLLLGGAADHVGRNYMCHIAGDVGELKLTAPVFHDYEISAEGTYCRRRFTVWPEAQRQAGMGNFAARLHFTDPTNPAHRSGVLSLAYLARALLRVEHAKRLQSSASVPGHLRNLLCDAPATAKFLARWIRRRTLARRKLPSVVVEPRSGCFSLDVHAEQMANRQSRVSLGDDLDALGIPEIRIDWRYSAVDMHTVLAGVRLIGDAIRRSGVGEFRFDPDEVVAGVLRHGAYGGHHIGTTRMSESAATGVVDGDCRVHGIQNLFVAGSAVFPSSSQAPPTLTIVAMALRLADHLATRLRSAP
jgi:choline dehydrogenase-like flavoprotein